ncbi:MAG: T9SS type A sorting domain-containing protein [Actinobacteria bacterium]|nr:T9SS type A sorting domain-containing protein [Actinomycetota bacterium]
MTERFHKLFYIFLVICIGLVFNSNPLLAQGRRAGREIRKTVTQLQRLIRQKQAQGVDVSGALELDRKSRQAMSLGRPRECLRLLRQAVALLKRQQDKEQQEGRSKPRISFFEVHLEPANANDGMFNALSNFVNLADQYKVKLTLLFTPPWAGMILEDSMKSSLLNQWRQNGHEIGGHHHGPSVCPWDGYTNLEVNGEEFEIRQNKVPCPEIVRAQEKYLGDMNDYMELLNGLGTIKTVTMSDEDVDWPAGAVYAAGGRKLQDAISKPRLVTFNGQQVCKLSSVTFLAKETVLGELITIEDLKNEYLSSKDGIFGINGKINSEDNLNLYRQWFEFLQEQNPEMKYAKTVSRIIQDLAKYKDSPFGFHPANVGIAGYPDNGFIDAENIGVRWHRPSRYAFWFLIQPDLNSPAYDFSLYDYQYSSVPQGINILANIAPENPRFPQGYTLTGSYVPVDIDKYKAFVRATVERYDGDGIGEEDFAGGVFPNPIKYWQVGNEPSDQLTGFAELQRITYEAIKEACSDCTVLIGGATGFPDDYISKFDSRFAPILTELAGQYVDVYDFHWYGTATGEYRLTDTATGEDVYAHIRAALTANGFSPDMPVWITEMGSYSGDPADPLFSVEPFQTERQQAGDYFKRFVYSLARGVKKIFPAFGLMEGFKHNDGYFDHTGLIYNGEGSNDLGLGVKKLAYFSYKLMTDKLEGSNWDSVQTLIDGTDNIYAYKFTKTETGGPVYVAWWDWFDDPGYSEGDTKVISLEVGSMESVKITQVVPKAESGTELDENNYPAFFATELRPVENGRVTFTLSKNPVFVEAESVPTTTKLPFESSRFGIFGAYALEYPWFMQQMGFDESDYWNWVDQHFVNLGTHWTRSNTQLIWELIDPELDGNYIWNIITNPDSVITNVYDSPAGVNWLGSIHLGLEPDGSFRNPLDYPAEWQNFVMAVVDRYNGDGNNDLNEFVHVKYWQIGNEIFQLKEAGLTPYDYAEIVALSESAIHAVDPNAKICLAAPTYGNDVDLFLQLTIQALANRGTTFNVIDIHHWDTAGNYKMQAVPFYRQLLDNNGYDNVEIWSCEHGTYCYQPANEPFQTKAEQAESLVKRYLWNFANGLDKLFWNNLMEWHGFAGYDGSIFNSMGLIGDGSYNGEPSEEFNHIRKSYYSYKKLAENIDTHKAEFIGENDFNDEQIGNYGYIYRDLETDTLFQFVWTDSNTTTFSFSISSPHEWTNLIPSDDEGKFESRILQTGNYNISIEAGNVFLLKMKSTTTVDSLLPTDFYLEQNYPNPFNPSTTIEYQIPVSSHVVLRIFNVLGQEVRTLVDENQPVGSHSAVWNGTDSFGKKVTGGIYFFKLRAKDFVQTKKLLLLK